MQAVLDNIAAVLYIKTAGFYFVLFITDSLDYLVGDILDIAVRLVVHSGVNSSAVVMSENHDKSRTEVLCGVFYAAQLM